jgi:DNA-binding response OmpR family regulator
VKHLVLCADDDEDILDLVELRLRRAGYDVQTASDGERALALARERPPAVAVLDVMMPRLSGLEVAAWMKADDDLRDVKIVLLSARVQEADQQRGLESGADAYLIKPFRVDELEQLVAELVPRTL